MNETDKKEKTVIIPAKVKIGETWLIRGNGFGECWTVKVLAISDHRLAIELEHPHRSNENKTLWWEAKSVSFIDRCKKA